MIRILDEACAGQIAAGEVIERPVSVVKELVENSLDAGACRVEVIATPDGLELTVTDDGCGMSPEDARLAFTRHATSKITGLADLGVVSTMGFRGEALPSIAAVAGVELRTRPANEDGATRVVLRDGRIVEHGPAAGAPGTTVRVHDLFHNLPVRRKHLKSDPYEFGLIVELVGRLALARTAVSFRLSRQGREVFYAPGSGGLPEAAAAVFGRETARGMFPFAGEAEGISFQGLAGHPSMARTSRRYQAIFVNGRWVRNYALSRAVEDAYKNLLMTGRFPLAVLDLRLDPGLVDVNVHPAKQDVRLLDEPTLSRLVREGVRQALARRSLVPVWPGARHEPAPRPRPVTFSFPEEREEPPGEPPWAANREPDRDPPLAAAAPTLGEEPAPYRPTWPRLTVLAWLAPTYILATGDGGLYIIDQHAAHERVLFEEHLACLTGSTPPAQILACPLTPELDAGHKAVLDKNLPLVESLGFALEPFGGAWLLRAGPAWGPPAPAESLLVDVLDMLLEKGGIARSDLVERLVTTWACKGAVKSGDRLDYPEMTGLVRRLGAAQAPYTCPHGRPTLIQIGERELLTRFKRIT
ncbi:MAG: DNA mismatch repair endonuclease MutL [Peptococcaceae bacterium]|jgi:DNA mismatch repair protein MutL|nr:DNA mismatch repair endonuclease MutL [Peptococcaceae bacterium]